MSACTNCSTAAPKVQEWHWSAGLQWCKKARGGDYHAAESCPQQYVLSDVLPTLPQGRDAARPQGPKAALCAPLLPIRLLALDVACLPCTRPLNTQANMQACGPGM